MMASQRVGHDWVMEQQQHQGSKYLLRAYQAPSTVLSAYLNKLVPPSQQI